MTLVGQYAQAIWQDQWTVLGLRLMPLTIGHGLLLHRVGSPLVGSGTLADVSLGDCCLAAWICSRPHDQARLDRRWTAMRLSWIGWMWSRGLWWLQRARLAAYYHAAWQGPRIWTRDGDNRKCATPTLMALKLSRMRELHATEAEAMATPIRLALWDLAGAIESVEPGVMVSEAEMSVPGASASCGLAGVVDEGPRDQQVNHDPNRAPKQ